MNETEWWSCQEPQEMLRFLRESGKLSKRKARLFAIACCRRIWPQMTDVRSRHATELAERSADEPVRDEELDAVSAEAAEAFKDSLTDDMGEALADGDTRPDAAAAASYASSPGALGTEHFDVVLDGASTASPIGADREKAAQAALLRDVFGLLPFHALPPLSPALLAWNEGLVVKLAQAAYEHRLLPAGALDIERLGVLADALEEGGCTDADLLAHLRSQGPHVRGCFAVDGLLERE